MSSSNSPRVVKCPHCGHDTFYTLENPHRPFCSARCRGVDLVRWADEDYKIPLQSRSDQTAHSTDENTTENDDYED